MTGERQLSGDLGSAQQLGSHTGKDHVGVHKEGKTFLCIALGGGSEGCQKRHRRHTVVGDD